MAMTLSLALVSLACAQVIPEELNMLFAAVGGYPGFSGAAPNGTVVVTQTEAGIRIAGTITGLPSNVTAGIHIHSGFSCADAAEVGGHYYEGMANDPWITTYTSDADGVASILMDMERFSLSEDMPVAGRTLVVHSPTSKIGCGVLEVSTGVVTHMGTYPGYSGAHSVKGTIVTTSTFDGIILTGTLAGLPADTTAGFHIHSGFSCAAAAGVGGHYFDGMDSDPWTTTYTSDSSGAAQISLPMTGFGMTSSMPVLGRTLVVHSSSSKIGCSLLSGLGTTRGDVEGSFKVEVPGCLSVMKVTGLHASLAAALAMNAELDTWQVVVDLSCDALSEDHVLLVNFKYAVPPGGIEDANKEINSLEEDELEHQIHVALQLRGISSQGFYVLQGSISGSAIPAVAPTSTVTLTSTSMSSTTGTVTTTSWTHTHVNVDVNVDRGLLGSLCGEEDLETCEASLLVVLGITACLLGAISSALLLWRRSPRPAPQDLPVILDRTMSSYNLSKRNANGEKRVEFDPEDGHQSVRELSFGALPALEDMDLHPDSGKNDDEAVSPSAVMNAVKYWMDKDEEVVVSRV